MKNIIGFATQFYTLWNYEAVNKYKTDSYGNHHLSGIDHNYSFIKNISTDLEKVKSLHPNTEIDESLRGLNSFTRGEKIDLPEGYFWGGKYAGKLIDEIMDIDFQYCIWSAGNYGGKTSDYIRLHSKYIAHFEQMEKEKQEKIDGAELLKAGDVVELEFTRNGYNPNEEYTECWTEAVYNEVGLAVNCAGVMPVSGIYPYLMPVVNGKAQRTKGKKLTVKVIEILRTELCDGIVKQFIKVA